MQHYSNHLSILKIKENFDNSQAVEKFQFNSVSTSQVYKLFKNINVKKATGTDKIPPKLVKISAEVHSQPLADAINKGVFLREFFLTMRKLHLFPLLTNNPMIKIKSQILNQLLL